MEILNQTHNTKYSSGYRKAASTLQGSDRTPGRNWLRHSHLLTAQHPHRPGLRSLLPAQFHTTDANESATDPCPYLEKLIPVKGWERRHSTAMNGVWPFRLPSTPAQEYSQATPWTPDSIMASS